MADSLMKGWHRRSDEELLSLRFRDLPLHSTDRLIASAVKELQRELQRRGLRFRPHVWLSDEWFSPDGVPGFAIPFYLAHPRLRRLERNQMLEVEGGTLRSCLRLMRHETGHAIDNAYRLRRRKERQRLFGSPSDPYPRSYAPRPFSRRFVRHLEFGYAQSHPDEDFAETFAVWLDPASRWRERYADWPALEKLLYIDELMREIGRRIPPVGNRRRPYPLSGLRRSLRTHYRIKRERYRVDFSQNYDEDLSIIFGLKGEVSASRFLERHRGFLRRQIARWTGIPGYGVDQVLKDWIERSRERGLRVRTAPEKALRDVVTALTVRVMQYLQSGNYRVAL
ncbi:MAG TPA: putative zinc-binding metallopeptidase [Vicinamibacteria bacterium]|nr:putative zinc-binding metallopeptidase [Vicinamibacteria bacterium]